MPIFFFLLHLLFASVTPQSYPEGNTNPKTEQTNSGDQRDFVIGEIEIP